MDRNAEKNQTAQFESQPEARAISVEQILSEVAKKTAERDALQTLYEKKAQNPAWVGLLQGIQDRIQKLDAEVLQAGMVGAKLERGTEERRLHEAGVEDGAHGVVLHPELINKLRAARAASALEAPILTHETGNSGQAIAESAAMRTEVPIVTPEMIAAKLAVGESTPEEVAAHLLGRKPSSVRGSVGLPTRFAGSRGVQSESAEEINLEEAAREATPTQATDLLRQKGSGAGLRGDIGLPGRDRRAA